MHWLQALRQVLRPASRQPMRRCVFVCWILLSLPIAASVRADEPASFGARLQLLGKPAIQAALESIDADGTLHFREDQRALKVAADQVVKWGGYRDRHQDGQVVLADGSLLAADFLELNSEHLEVSSELFGDLKIPLSQIAGMLLLPPVKGLARDEWIDELQAAEAGRDQLRLDNGDLLRGLLVDPPAEQGEVEDQEEVLWVALEGQPRPVALSRIVSFSLNPALRQPTANANPRNQASLRCGFADGTRLDVRRVEWGEQIVTLYLPGGLELSTETLTFREQCTLLQPWTPTTRYLSDLPTLGYRHVPFLQRTWNYGTDRNVLGGRLRTQDELYFKGLGMHSTSRLAYDVPAGAERFVAELALDQTAGKRGSVVYRVFLTDSEGKWSGTPAYQSKIVRGGQPPVPVSIELAGARRLALIVDFADWGDQHDHANWLDARFEP